jgi:hypothetical protein
VSASAVGENHAGVLGSPSADANPNSSKTSTCAGFAMSTEKVGIESAKWSARGGMSVAGKDWACGAAGRDSVRAVADFVILRGSGYDSRQDSGCGRAPDVMALVHRPG